MLALALSLAATAGCTTTKLPLPDHGDRRAGCGPLSYEKVRGRPPAYLDTPALDRFRNDHAVCAGVWLRSGRGFVPQGVVADDWAAWVSGFDGAAALHHRYCAIVQVDLRTGRTMARHDPVTGQVGDRDPVTCRHGGGLVRDTHGLWLVETSRLWLIEPGSLDVLRVWALADPLRGSFALLDGAGRLGIGRWDTQRPGQVDWFDTDDLVASDALDITLATAQRSTPAPRGTQGAVWGALGRGRPGAWFVQSVSRCGVLVGPEGTRRRAFVPGAEGMSLAGKKGLWVVSESGTKHYQGLGGRPVVPMLVRLDLSDFASWRRPDCSV